MTVRVLRGLRPDGSFGFDVSKPGFDVRTADNMHMAYSTRLQNPKVVISGTAVMAPTAGYRGKDHGLPGGQATTLVLPFGRTVSPIPFVAAVAMSPDWTIPLPARNGQLGYLANQWHTYLYENFSKNGDLTYGTSVNRVAPGASGDANTVSESWSCCRFIISVSFTAITITMNSAGNLTVKYLVLDYS